MAGNVELDGDPGFELFNKTAFPNYGGGSTLVLPLLLFIVQVGLLLVMCYKNIIEEKEKAASVLQAYTASLVSKPNNNTSIE